MHQPRTLAPQQSVDNEVYSSSDGAVDKCLDNQVYTSLTINNGPEPSEQASDKPLSSRVQKGCKKHFCLLLKVIVSAALPVLIVLTVINMMKIRELSQQPLKVRPTAQLAKFVLDLSKTTSCHGNGPDSRRQPCWTGRRLMTLGSLGPLRQIGEPTEDLVLTSSGKEILVRRDGVYAVDARARVRFRTGYLQLSGGLAVNGSLSNVICEDKSWSVPAKSVVLLCQVNSFVRLKAGDRLSLVLLLLSGQELQVTESSTFIKVVAMA